MEALSALYDITSKPLYALCYSYFKKKEDAEDALSDTYIKAVKEIEKYYGKNGFNWLYTLCKNICLNHLKKNQYETSVDLQDEKTIAMLDQSDAETLHIPDESGIIALAKRYLSEEEFRILILHAVGGYPFKDIAALCKRLETTVRWQYHNAIKKLQKHEKEVTP